MRNLWHTHKELDIAKRLFILWFMKSYKNVQRSFYQCFHHDLGIKFKVIL